MKYLFYTLLVTPLLFASVAKADTFDVKIKQCTSAEEVHEKRIEGDYPETVSKDVASNREDTYPHGVQSLHERSLELFEINEDGSVGNIIYLQRGKTTCITQYGVQEVEFDSKEEKGAHLSKEDEGEAAS